MRFLLATTVTILTACVACQAADLNLDHQRNSTVSLAGEWQLLVEHGEEEVFKSDVAGRIDSWQPVNVPGGSLLTDEGREKPKEFRESLQCVWIRRNVELTEEQAGRGAVLKWNGIRFGATAWINGRKVTEHVPVGPHTVILPSNTLKAGANEIVLKIPGWAGVPKSKTGYPLTPTGGATQGWGGKWPGVYGDIWLEFYDQVYIRSVLAMPDLADKSVTFRITLDGATTLPQKLKISASVMNAEDNKGAGTVSNIEMDSNALTVTTKVRVDDALPWTPQTPKLYRATIRLTSGEWAPRDEVSFTIGMRHVTVKDGHFSLNGRPLWLRGSNLVNEWLWGDKFNDNIKTYLVDEARAMSLNCFRTHTQPPPAAWLDIADREGMMILAEMPLLYNHGDFGFTPEEFEIFHRNALLDAEGWVARMWNHPSIIMWVASNESNLDNEWESTELYRHIKTLDPTRLVMRTGEHKVGTPDMVDIHTCFNVVRGAEGQLIVDMAELMAKKDPARPLTNTEYMNWMWDPSGRWMGSEKHPGMTMAYAECAMEHTEAMRRLRFDCLLPYMYAGWTRLNTKAIWRDDFPTPMAAALHSSMAPVLASLDLFDRNFVAGSEREVPLVLINETHEKVPVTVDLVVTPRDPLLIPEPEALAAAVWRGEPHKLTLEPDSQQTIKVRIAVPKAEGNYFVAAVLSREGARPVVSQRVLRSVDPAKQADRLKGRRILLLGATDSLREFLKRQECVVSEALADGKVEADVVVIDDAGRLTPEAMAAATPALKAFAEAGGRIVILEQLKWSWAELVDCTIGLPEFQHLNPVVCSRAHRFEGADHTMLRDIPADWLWRWNGLPGAIANETILSGPALEKGNKILWASRPVFTTNLSVPMGKGEILMNQLQLRHRLDPAAATYDPVAERLLVNMLCK